MIESELGVLTIVVRYVPAKEETVTTISSMYAMAMSPCQITCDIKITRAVACAK